MFSPIQFLGVVIGKVPLLKDSVFPDCDWEYSLLDFQPVGAF